LTDQVYFADLFIAAIQCVVVVVVFDNIVEVYLNVASNIAFCIAVFKSFPFFTRIAKFLKLLLNFR